MEWIQIPFSQEFWKIYIPFFQEILKKKRFSFKISLKNKKNTQKTRFFRLRVYYLANPGWKLKWNESKDGYDGRDVTRRWVSSILGREWDKPIGEMRANMHVGCCSRTRYNHSASLRILRGSFQNNSLRLNLRAKMGGGWNVKIRDNAGAGVSRKRAGTCIMLLGLSLHCIVRPYLHLIRGENHSYLFEW